jgi:hypothetical protein
MEQNVKESGVNHKDLYSEINTFLRMEAKESMTEFDILQYISVISLI